ncbi:sugar transferase [Anaerostipes sp.]|uniref:sugar transferase n=1 Tax=Anaerostipes sp. TaxID=1872530 RepID=UPI0025C65881|nr:sugar transferase [Anaerostipes sp.]
MKKIQYKIKRAFDFGFSVLMLTLFFPFFLIISIVIKADGGSVFFLQDRIGKKGKKFKMIKFRTMIENAENLGDGLIVRDESDSRITKFGRFMRKTSLDELPQLINIIVGDMSIVGPRPPVVYHPYNGYKNYPDWAKKRFEVKPGITGLAQVKVRNSATWEDRMKLDKQYVEKFSLWMDVKIMFLTIRAMFYKETFTGE